MSRHCAYQALTMLKTVLPDSLELLQDVQWSIDKWGLGIWQEALRGEHDEERCASSFLAERLCREAGAVARRLPRETANSIATQLEGLSFEERAKVHTTLAEITRVSLFACEEQEALRLTHPPLHDCLTPPVGRQSLVLTNALERVDTVLGSVDETIFEQALLTFIGATLCEMTPQLRQGLGLLSRLLADYGQLVATEHEWKHSPWSGRLLLYLILGSS